MITLGDIKLFTLDELAKTFNVTSSTLRNYMRAGKLRGQKVGGKWYTSEENLREFFHGEGKKHRKREVA